MERIFGMHTLLQFALFAIALCTVHNDHSLDRQWKKWKNLHKMTFGSLEEELRRSTWEKNLRYVGLHNLEFIEGKHSYTLGMNGFSHLTSAEFLMQFGQTSMTSFSGSINSSMFHSQTKKGTRGKRSKLPAAVDWRQEGYVTPVKNQNRCGSSSAFSATGSMEGQQFKKSGKLVSLSEENIIDCCQQCNHDMADAAFEYVMENGGIDVESCYPNDCKELCRFNKSCVGARVRGWVDVLPAGDEYALQAAVATVGPVSVALDAGLMSFQLYRSGVYYDPSCSSKNVDHSLLAVGYGTVEGGSDYWIVKNSWGESWGMNGYILVARNKNNTCGIASFASYPLVV